MAEISTIKYGKINYKKLVEHLDPELRGTPRPLPIGVIYV